MYGPANPGKKTRNRSVQILRSRKVVVKKPVETRSTFRAFPSTLLITTDKKRAVYARGKIKQKKRKQGSGNWRTFFMFLSQRTGPGT